MEKFLAEITAIPGVPGYEKDVGDYVAGEFGKYADEIRRDAMENVIAKMGSEGPKVMVSAHQDEIGLMVTKIEDDGCLRIWRNGGVDPRILPAMEVSVCAKGGPLYGVIGAKPPHLLSPEDAGSVVSYDDLYVDIGFGAEKARELVRVGDPVVMLAKTVKLACNSLAGKTMDDRASVASLVVAMELYKRISPKAQTYFVASTQEEVGLKGAKVAAFSIAPDFAIAVDVTHGEGPGTGKWEAFPNDKMTIATGPNLHPMLVKKAEECARKWHIPFAREVASRPTGTDANAIQIAHGGVPVILLSVPLKYMHTTVETLKLDVIDDVGRLITLLIDDIAGEWEDLKWY